MAYDGSINFFQVRPVRMAFLVVVVVLLWGATIHLRAEPEQNPAQQSGVFDEMDYVVGETDQVATQDPEADGAAILPGGSRLPVIHVAVEWNGLSRPISPATRGICLVPGPKANPNYLDGAGVEAVLPVFKGTSARVWATMRPETGMGPWSPFIEAMAPATYFIVYPPAVIEVKRAKIEADYVSETENNLPAATQPRAVAKAAKAAYVELRRLVGDDSDIYFEVYNEPQFAKKGNWKPEPFAAYANDVARHIRELEPGLKIAVPMHLADADWNRALLKDLIPEMVDCIVNHNYGIAWISASKATGDTYYTRVGELARQRQLLREDLSAVRQIGGGKWKYAITEWSVHPEGYRGTVPSSTDLAAALYDACLLGMFTELGVDYAQRFQLVGTSHFGLIESPDAGLTNPTFEVARLFSEYFVGDSVPVTTDSPGFRWESFPPAGSSLPKMRFEVPYVHVFASREGEELSLILVNLNRESEATVQLEILKGISSTLCWMGEQLSGEAESVHVDEVTADYSLKNITLKPESLLVLPPSSVTALHGFLPED